MYRESLAVRKGTVAGIRYLSIIFAPSPARTPPKPVGAGWGKALSLAEDNSGIFGWHLDNQIFFVSNRHQHFYSISDLTSVFEILLAACNIGRLNGGVQIH